MENYKRKYEQAMFRMNKWVEGSEITEPKEVAEFVFPELCESEDEKIRKELIEFVKSRGGFKQEYIAWLEKQDPKKHEEELEKAYKCADEVQYRKGYEDAKREIENQNEQKPTDKVEPIKIEKDKWYICIRDLYDNYYTRAFCKGRTYHAIKDETLMPDNSNIPCEIKYFVNDYFHLWTIQDANDGDVLVCSWQCNGKKIEQVGIYKEYIGRHGGCSNCFKIYVGIDWDKHLLVDSIMGSSEIYPATKEQRDLLFQKMKEAGYEWDAEKKELKKIEQEQTELPNGEDYGIDSLYHAVRILEKTLGEVEGYQSDDGILEHKCAIEAVKHLYKQKPIWSEEDEIGLSNAMWAIEQARTIAKDENDMGNLWHAGWWLNSLKKRYTWKPSDEQMQQLGWVAEQNKDNMIGKELMSLYQDLKKLKDE